MLLLFSDSSLFKRYVHRKKLRCVTNHLGRSRVHSTTSGLTWDNCSMQLDYCFLFQITKKQNALFRGRNGKYKWLVLSCQKWRMKSAKHSAISKEKAKAAKRSEIMYKKMPCIKYWKCKAIEISTAVKAIKASHSCRYTQTYIHSYIHK